MQKEQTVSEMVEEVLVRQAKTLAHRSGQSLEDARQAVADTEAGRQLRKLAKGEHRHEKAQDWQVSALWKRAEGRSPPVVGELHGVVGRQGRAHPVPRATGGGAR